MAELLPTGDRDRDEDAEGGDDEGDEDEDEKGNEDDGDCGIWNEECDVFCDKDEEESHHWCRSCKIDKVYLNDKHNNLYRQSYWRYVASSDQ